MTLFAQLVATAFQLVSDRVWPQPSSDPAAVEALNRYVRENHQLRLVLADTRKDLEQIRDRKQLTKAQMLDQVQVVLGRIDLVLASLRGEKVSQ